MNDTSQEHQQTPVRLLQKYQVILFFFLLLFVLWLPFGWRTTGTFEEWEFLYHYNQPEFSFLTPNDIIRPLNAVVFYFGFVLTPDSFVGLQVITMVMLALKGILFYQVMRRVLKADVLALAVAGLYVIFPSDIGIFTPRTVNIHTAIVLYLLATILLFRLYESFHWTTVIGMTLSLVASLLMYDATYLIIALSPILLVTIHKQVNRKLILLAAWWYGIMFILGTRFILLSTGDSLSYQSRFLREDILTQVGLQRTFASLWLAYQRNLYLGWKNALQIVLDSPLLYLGLGFLITVLFASGLWRVARRQTTRMTISRLYIGAMIAGLLVIGIGVFMFLFTEYDEGIFRVYLHSSMGSALFGVMLILCIVALFPRKIRTLLFIMVCSVFFFVAVVNSFFQHRSYVSRSATQQKILSAMVEQMPSHEAAWVVIVDETQYMYPHIFSLDRHPAIAYSDIYDSDIQLQVCTLTPAHRNYSRCNLNATRLVINPPQQERVVVDLNNLILFRYTLAHELELVQDLESWLSIETDRYQPDQLICSDCAPPPNVRTVLSTFPFADEHSPLHDPPTEFYFDFDIFALYKNWHWIGVGANWTADETVAGRSVRRMSQNTADLKLFLKPQDYRITFQVMPDSNVSDLLSILAVNANGQALVLTGAGQGIFQAELPAQILEDSSAYLILQFTINQSQLAQNLAFDYIKISPLPA